jgi:putative oxidoreductase
MEFLLRIRRFIHTAADRLAWLPPTLARIAIGVTFLGTGWGKLHNLDKTTEFFTQLHIPAPGFNALIASCAEFFCGLLILAGLFTRLAALPLIVVMIVAITTAKRAEIGSFADLVGFDEFNYIVMLLFLTVTGAGPLSLDRVLSGFVGRGRSDVGTAGSRG